jgi:hypothetical protein
MAEETAEAPILTPNSGAVAQPKSNSTFAANAADTLDLPDSTDDLEFDDPGPDTDNIPPEAEDDNPVPSESPETSEPAEPEGEGIDEAGFRDELLQRAEDAGFTAEDAKAFGSPENLARALAAQDRALALLGRQELGMQSPEATPEQAKEPEKQEAQPAPDISGMEKFKIELDPDDYSEELTKAVTGMNDHYDSIVREQGSLLKQIVPAILELHQELTQFTGHSQAEAVAQFEQELDTSFTTLGDEYKDKFGAGPIRQLDPNSSEYINRNKLVEEMNAIAAGEARARPNGRPASSRSQLFQRALYSLYPDAIKSTVRKEILGKAQERNGQSLARPTGRQSKPLTGEERAVKTAEAWYRNRAATFESQPSEI